MVCVEGWTYVNGDGVRTEGGRDREEWSMVWKGKCVKRKGDSDGSSAWAERRNREAERPWGHGANGEEAPGFDADLAEGAF